MYEYMRALHDRFFEESQAELDQRISELHQALIQRLEKPERKTLMYLLEAQDALKNEVSLASFIAGFRLASGIAEELAGKQYSFDEDAFQRFRKARKEDSPC